MNLYAIGDIHGDYDRATELLREAGLINSRCDWVGGADEYLVCTGDLTDRGPDGLKVIELFMNLQRNGHVDVCLGNHDVLIVMAALAIRERLLDNGLRSLLRMNGCCTNEALELLQNEDMMFWMQNLPLRVKIEDVLFQHCDSVKLYNTITQDHKDELIMTAEGAYALFGEMTESRNWDRHFGAVRPYLQECGSRLVVHGHTPHMEKTAKVMDQTVNIDGLMSCGYDGKIRLKEKRGFVWKK